jgi:hypothetical protein
MGTWDIGERLGWMVWPLALALLLLTAVLWPDVLRFW